MKNTALIIIDIQNDYFENGKMELDRPLPAAQAARQVLEHFRAEEGPIFHVRHESVQPGATFMIPNTKGAKVHELVAPLKNETVITKNTPNSFRGTPLLQKLKEAGVEHVVVVGMMTFMCVDATVRAADDYGFKCTVLHDATASRALEFDGQLVPASQVQAAFIAALGSACATVESTASFL